jgi:hypothetical protein
MASTVETMKAKIKAGERLRLPEAVLYLKSRKQSISEVQLRDWHAKGLIPGYKPLKGSPLLLEVDTLDRIASGELPAVKA